MTYRPLGRCGTKVSTLSLGGWTTFGGSITSERTTREILHAAFDAGVNFFDIADVYALGAAETIMGKALAALPRHHLVISSKCFWPMSQDVNDRGLSRKHIVESVERSLQRIGTDYLDILFCHRYDEETPLEETVRAMEDLIRQGKLLYWGTSEWTGAQIREAHAIADRRNAYGPQVEQPQYNLLVRDKVEGDVQPAAEDHGMGLVVWSPLASGLLTGKYDDAVPEDTRLARIEWLREQLFAGEGREKTKAMKATADRLGCTRTQLALAWAAAQPGVSSVILGATSIAQLQENLGALEVTVDDEARAALDDLFPASGN
ncbi:MAG: aldo/keto reductase [Planctomycetota bacterium]|nr:aldo/keto reductase [Planctomycetota bacterium]